MNTLLGWCIYAKCDVRYGRLQSGETHHVHSQHEPLSVKTGQWLIRQAQTKETVMQPLTDYYQTSMKTVASSLAKQSHL